MRDNGLIILILFIFGTIIIIGGHFAINMSGEIKPVSMENHWPGVLNVIKYAWDGLTFFFMFLGFSVSGGSGDIASIIAWVFLIIGIVTVWILIKWIRGTSSGV